RGRALRGHRAGRKGGWLGGLPPAQHNPTCRRRTPMKLMIYAIIGRGMGHLNRTLVLAHAIRKLAPTHDIVFVVGSPVFGIVNDAGFEVVKVPDTHHTLGFFTGLDNRQSFLNDVFRSLVEHYEPDVFLADFIVNADLFSEVK